MPTFFLHFNFFFFFEHETEYFTACKVLNIVHCIGVQSAGSYFRLHGHSVLASHSRRIVFFGDKTLFASNILSDRQHYICVCDAGPF